MKKLIINKDFIQILLSILFFVLSFFCTFFLKHAFLFLSYVLVSYPVYIDSLKSIFKGEIFDENFLMILATIGAMVIGKYEEAVMVILLFQIGEYFSDLAVDHSKEAITSLMDLRSDSVFLKTKDGVVLTDIHQVQLGDLFIVKPGEKIALDGNVVHGKSFVDTSSLTGESVPKEVKKGSTVLSGFVNQEGVLTIEATSVYETSTAAKIIQLMEESNTKKTETEKFITKFSKIYTPIVVVLAFLLVFIPVLLGKSFDEYLYRSLVFLVTSCPCALVLSVPLGYFCGIGRSSKEKILVKGSRELDALSSIQMMVFDKTGTITEGVFEVCKIESSVVSEEELLEIAAYSEYYSLHPIAQSILHKYSKKIEEKKIQNFQEISGKGITAIYQDDFICIGNIQLMKKEKVKCQEIAASGTVVYIARNRKYLGYLVISDQIKKEAYSFLSELSRVGISDVVMLSGDQPDVVSSVASEIGIKRYEANLLPIDKVKRLEEFKKTASVSFVGDGINDAPVLKMSDVGISMGGVGSDAAIEASDVVLMEDDLSKIPKAIKISHLTRRVVRINIAFSIVIKTLVLFLGMFGKTTIWLAVFADVGVTLLSVLHTLQIMVRKIS